ncbi:MAG: hypothetical protein JXR65_07145 [Bacteroidales bacterium]|nr:hypothetical protein [Bacteroidales bacterium]
MLFKNNVEMYIFHREEYHSTDTIDGIKLINISKYELTEIYYLIKRINPNLFVIFGFRSFFELILIRLFNFLNVNIIYIQHGLISRNHISFFSRISSVNFKTSFVNYLHFTKLFFQFINLNPRNVFREIKIIIRALFFTRYSNVGIDEFYLFSKEAFKVHEKIFSFSERDAKIIGYPLFKVKTNIPSQTVINNTLKKRVLYIHENFIQMKLTKINYHQERDYIQEIATLSKQYGYDFIMQLHPMEDFVKYSNLYKETDIKLFQEGTLNDLVNESSIILGHSSTALFVPILLGKPLIILGFPGSKLKIDEFADVSLTLGSLKEYESLLCNPENLISKLGNYGAYKEEHLGTQNSYEDYCNLILGFLQREMK